MLRPVIRPATSATAIAARIPTKKTFATKSPRPLNSSSRTSATSKRASIFDSESLHSLAKAIVRGSGYVGAKAAWYPALHLHCDEKGPAFGAK